MLDKSVRNFLKTRVAKLAIAVLIAAAGLGLYINRTTRPIVFDSATWREKPAQRYRMIKSLLDSRQLDALPEGEMVNLLGEPKGRTGDTFLWSAPSRYEESVLLVTVKEGRVTEVQRGGS